MFALLWAHCSVGMEELRREAPVYLQIMDWNGFGDYLFSREKFGSDILLSFHIFSE
jgi:hypothetical protein